MLRSHLICTAGFLMAVSLLLAPAPVIAAVSGTPHDFTDNANFTTLSLTTNAGFTCEGCHTPHGAQQQSLIWAQSLSTALTGFTAGQTTLNGTSLPTDIPGSPGPSYLCLSCHDGTVAVGGHIDAGNTATMPAGFTIGTGGNIDNNHPVEIPYPDATAGTYNGIATQTALAGAPYPDYTTLTTLSFALDGAQPGVSCATCHDPHGTANASFLRVAGDSICQTCHTDK